MSAETEFEQHLAGCESCRSEIDSLRETAALLAETTAATPSAGLRERVLAEIGTKLGWDLGAAWEVS